MNEDKYYRSHGTVNPVDPIVVPHNEIRPPTGGVFHYLLESSMWYPDNNDLHIYTEKYLMGHITSLTKSEGRPRIASTNSVKRAPSPLRRPIHSVNIRTSIVFNYLPLNHYRYRKGPYVTIYKARNMFNTLIDTVIETAATSRTQYIVMDMPERMSYSYLNKLTGYSDRKLGNNLKSVADWNALELHKWLTNKASLWSLLPSDVDIMLLWRNKDKHVVLSLNYLKDIVDDETPVVFGVRKQKVSESKRTHYVSDLIEHVYDLVSTPTPKKIVSEQYIEETAVDEANNAIASVVVPTVPTTNKEALQIKLDTMSAEGTISVKQLNKANVLMRGNTPNAYSTEPIEKYAVVSPSMAKLVETSYVTNHTVLDPSMNSSNIADYESKYIDHIKDRHMAAVIDSFQKGGVIVHKHSKELKTGLMGDTEVHTLSVSMVDGGKSTLTMRLPSVQSDGTYMANGSEYRMRKQKVDIPIRKIEPNVVTLISYYGSKQFVTRSELAVDDPFKWISTKMINRSLDANDNVTILSGDVYDNHNTTPSVYGFLARHIDTVTTPTYTVSFNYDKRTKYGPDKPNAIALGKHKAYGVMYIDNDNNISTSSRVIGTIYDLFGLDGVKAPKPTVYIKIAGKRLYVGMLLVYLLGISKLLKILEVNATVHKPRTKVDSVLQIRFSDSLLVVEKASPKAILILNGILKYKTHDMTYADMDTKEGVSAVMAVNDFGNRQFTEYELINDMFIDPIIKEVLERMNEPTVYIPLVIRACEMLTLPEHTDSADSQRIRGYERYPGAVYTELVASIRAARSKTNVTARRIEMSPFAVWGRLTQDSAKKITENTNPIMQLRDVESVILSGDGGRTGRTLTIDARKYHKADIGVLSESVPDNGDVGITSFLTIQPSLNSVYGDTEPTKELNRGGMSKYFSTSAAYTAGIYGDDYKRRNFVGIQNQHTVAVAKMTLPYVRTGYECIIPQRLSDLYATIAKQPGKVLSLEPTGIIVRYKDGTEQGIELGIRYSRAEGAMYPNEVITKLSKGQSFKAGDAIAYHAAFFEMDPWENQLLYKQTQNITTALYEGSMTYEDSCTLDVSVTDGLTSETIVLKESVLTFNQAVHALVKVGNVITVGDILYTLEDESTTSGGFSGTVLENIQDLSSQSAYSKYNGIIDRIEMIYHGQITDMSPTLMAITKRSNARFKKVAESTGKPYHSGQVDSEYRLKGDPLQPDTCELRIYIKVKNVPANADKFVLGAQLKCTVSDVTDGIRTESGTLIEAGFSGISVGARIVDSYYTVSVLSTLLKHLPSKLLSILED